MESLMLMRVLHSMCSTLEIQAAVTLGKPHAYQAAEKSGARLVGG
jgi:hypothetical protein